MTAILISAMGLAAFMVFGVFVFRTFSRNMEDILMRNRMESSQVLKHAMDDMRQGLETVRQEVDRKLSETVTKNFESFGAVSKRLEELQKVTNHVVDLSQGVKGLSRILESPKLRGAMGEFQLMELMRQVLPNDLFEEQVAIDPKSKELVDAVIKFSEGILCIDSKFPLESAKILLSEEDVAQDVREQARKAFRSDVKSMADSIASKYIIPEKTLDFAFMFIPAETVYLELMKDSGLHDYCLKKHVIPVSPSSFYAYLKAIAVGFRGLKIQAEAKKIASALGGLRGDFDRLQTDFAKVGKHLKDAQTQYQNVENRIERIGNNIEKVSGHSNESLEPSSTAPQLTV